MELREVAMYIVDQNRLNVVNLDNVVKLSLNGKGITYNQTTNERYCILGHYTTEERAKEIWDDLLLRCLALTETVETYYMPTT